MFDERGVSIMVEKAQYHLILRLSLCPIAYVQRLHLRIPHYWCFIGSYFQNFRLPTSLAGRFRWIIAWYVVKRCIHVDYRLT